jgi:dipeptidyl aminopeptidase/acylaminoacyl peptidase
MQLITRSVAIGLFLVAPFGLVPESSAAQQRMSTPAASIPAAAPARAGRAFQPSDWYRVTTLGSAAMSPDGKLVAFTVTTVDEADNKRHSEVWAAGADGGEPFRLTSPGTESSNPRWSHDGKILFFTSQRPGGRGSTWALRMDGPRSEAVQIEYPNGSVPADGRFAVFTAPADGNDDEAEGGRGGRGGESRADSSADRFARMPAMARPPLGSITRPLDARRFDGRHVVDLAYKANGRGFVPNRREPQRFRAQQLWIQSFADTVRRRITNTPYSHRNAIVSPDGRWIAFTADAQLRSDSVVQAERDSLAPLPYDSARDEAERNDSDIFIVPVTGGEPRRLTTMNGSEAGVAWAPDSRAIAFTSARNRTAQRKLYLVPLEGGEPRDLLGDWQYEPGGIEFAPNGDIFLDASVGGRSALFRVEPKSGKMTEVLAGRRRISGSSFDRKYTRVAFVATDTDEPTELYIADANGRNERKLTGFNDALNAEVAWADSERFTFTSVGGLEIEAWLMKPYGYQPGRRYPLVLYIHGGPHSAYGEGWFDEFQNIAGAGMWVLYTNPRGSSGYGAEFTYSTRGRWGMEDYEDLMKAVDIVAQRPDVDSTRMGVTGGSYGGFMTAWITTKTNRFKAAQTDRMISNWFSWYGSSDAQGLTEFEFFGKPWDNLELYWDLSPLKYVDRVRTPTLIVQSEEDHRTPMSDAEQWFMALRKQNVPVEFVRYPRSTHDLSRTGEPWLLVDRLARLRQWFSHWLLGSAGVSADQTG